MSEKIYAVYFKQIDQYYMECDPAEFAQKTMSLLNSGFIDPFLSPSEYMLLCKYRARLVIGNG